MIEHAMSERVQQQAPLGKWVGPAYRVSCRCGMAISFGIPSNVERWKEWHLAETSRDQTSDKE